MLTGQEHSIAGTAANKADATQLLYGEDNVEFTDAEPGQSSIPSTLQHLQASGQMQRPEPKLARNAKAQSASMHQIRKSTPPVAWQLITLFARSHL